MPDDLRDNDLDGLTDERRDNLPTRFITDPGSDPFLRDVVQDTAQFHLYYGRPWRPHWDADENCNWRPYADLNADGVWDTGEPLNDDVGTRRRSGLLTKAMPARTRTARRETAAPTRASRISACLTRTNRTSWA